MKFLSFFLATSSIVLLAACSSSKKATQQTTPGGSKTDTYSNTYSSQQAELLDQATFKLDSVSADESYGYTQGNPVHVGGSINGGAYNQRRFLNALLGPAGEAVTYRRIGSCCHFNTKNGFSGGGLLDKYEVSYEGIAAPVVLFLNFYDYGVLRAPKGFTYKK